MKCPKCDFPAMWFVHAAADVDTTRDFPLVERYHMPRIVACDEHLAAVIREDLNDQNGTNLWVVKPVAQDEEDPIFRNWPDSKDDTVPWFPPEGPN